MTSDQMKALAARLREHAQLHREHLPQDHEQQQWTADLDHAANLIEQMAQAEPVATVYYPRTGGNVGVSWMAIPETGAMPPEGAKLYLAPPAREPLSDAATERGKVPHFPMTLTRSGQINSY